MAGATKSDWYLYLVRCANGNLYAGITTDVQRRLLEHRSGQGKGAKYLRGKGPLELVWSRSVANRSLASQLESRLKSISKNRKEALIAGKWQLEDLSA